MPDSGTVDRDGFKLEWAREGTGIPMMVLGARHFYPRYFPSSLRERFEIAFCDLRQWVPTPLGFDIGTITLDTFSEDVDALRRAVLSGVNFNPSGWRWHLRPDKTVDGPRQVYPPPKGRVSLTLTCSRSWRPLPGTRPVRTMRPRRGSDARRDLCPVFFR